MKRSIVAVLALATFACSSPSQPDTCGGKSPPACPPGCEAGCNQGFLGTGLGAAWDCTPAEGSPPDQVCPDPSSGAGGGQ
jgi:hypothetical protein